MNKELRELCVNQYIKGKTIEEICKLYTLKWASVYRILNNRNLEIKEEKEICSYYINGKSTVYISNLYSVNHHLISKILEKHNIERIGNGKRKYKLNETYFDEIDTQTKAYILGFFYADGSNSISKSTISMSLQEDDKDILERIRHEVESEKPLEYIDYSYKNLNDYTYKNQYRLLFFSSHMSESLSDKGMVQNKSLVLEFPEWLDDKLISHFIRGYFDGDGCVHFAKNGNCVVNMTSTNNFCKYVKQYIETTLSIHVSLSDASCRNGITKVLQISGKNQVKTFLDFIYKDAAIYLERKHNSYLNKYYNFSQAA